MFGTQFAVDLIRKIGKSARGEDQWEAKARAHTGRTAPDATIIVSESEILADADADAGFDLQKAMADERAALDAAGLSAANLIERHRAALKEAGKFGGDQ